MWQDIGEHLTDPSKRDLENKLKVAMIKEDYTAFRRLVKGGVDVNTKRWFESTLLHDAIQMGNEQFVNILLKANACVDVCNKNGRTPLHLAARSGNAAIVKMLLEKGANVNGRVRNPSVESEDSNSCSQTPLLVAAWKGRDEVVRLLLKAGADVNAVYEGGWMAIHWAAKSNNVGILKELVSHGSYIDKPVSKVGYTPLIMAMSNNQTDSTLTLVLNGANVNGTVEGKTPISHLLDNKNIPPKSKLELANVFSECGLEQKMLKTHSEELKKLEKQSECIGVPLLSEIAIPSLTFLCRVEIRRHLMGLSSGKSIFRDLQKLPLPRILSEFLTFSDRYKHIYDT